MLDLSTFRARHPEFANVADGLITIALADAWRRVSPAVYGTQIDRAHALTTAHDLASAPWGYQARLEGTKDGSTVYSGALQRLIEEVGAGFGVT